MIYRVVELTMLWPTVTNLTVELTAAHTWPLTDPARGNLLKILVIIIGICDVKDGGEPGDLGWNPNAPVSGSRPKWFGPTFSAKYSQEEFGQLRLREIKHARLAMFGFAFMAVQNAITGSTPTLLFLSFEKPEYVTPVGDFIPKNL